MRRSILLAMSVALVVLVFAPFAAAQTYYRGGNNQGMNSGGMNHMGRDDNMMASPTSGASSTAMSSASATASPTASASASPSASASASASAPSATSSAASGSALPDTGGVPLAPLLSVGALAFLLGSGALATGLVRRY